MEIFKLPNNPSLSRKERERLFKRREILVSACKIFSEKGFETTTLDEVAEASEYGKGTLYNYFQNKEDIYLALLEAILTDYLDSLKKLASDSNNFNEFMLTITEELFKLGIEHETIFLLLIRMRGIPSDDKLLLKNERIDKLIREINTIYKLVIDNSSSNKIFKNIDLEAMLVLYRNMVFSYIYHLKYCKEMKEIDVKKESAFIYDIFLNGIKNN